jgi:A1 cistron-splicing factor AAR2
MDNATALEQFTHGAFFIFDHAPQGMDFGIDQHAWTIGPRFKGVKMIPPGLHFIHYGFANDMRPRVGFFHFFQSKQVRVSPSTPA